MKLNKTDLLNAIDQLEREALELEAAIILMQDNASGLCLHDVAEHLGNTLCDARGIIVGIRDAANTLAEKRGH